ncbi:MAG: prolipoprotein diacylglyceryl transferase [Verrucomicrobia bacterium]|nr:prolipoprotein diacylglyceryl transferase [Verrucomicrobiota bacterium]
MGIHYFFWDPAPSAFTIPIIDHPIRWYSICFALGFLGAYLIFRKLVYSYLHGSDKTTLTRYIDKLSWYLFVGLIVGARLGHVFFYDWPYYKAHPAKIVAVWEGGLASHGAAIGVLIALLLFWRRHKSDIPSLSLKKLLDFLSIGAAFAAGCIRIGNFFNQEILGTYTTAWTAVWFGHPAEAWAKMPCHPVQLYEAAFYFSLCIVLLIINKIRSAKDGFLAGLFFVTLFTFRFFIEQIKLPQTATDATGLHMGQWLSVPFIILGLCLLFNQLGIDRIIKRK